MSKKTLLNETTVRRFMKLADMGTLSDNFINEAGLYQADEDEKAMEEGGMMGAAYQDDEPEMDDMDAEAPEMPGDEGPEDEPMPEEEPEEAPEMDADEVEISEDDRAALSAAIPVLEKIAGGAGDADMGMDMGMDEPMPEEPMADEEEPMMEGADLSTKGKVGKGTFSGQKDHKLSKAKVKGLAGKGSVMEEGEGSEEGEEVLDEVEVVDENELVQEVTRRVAARLRAAMKSRK